MIYALGNHDCYPFHCITPNCAWLTKVAQLLKRLGVVNADQEKTFQKGGYYAVDVEGIKIIVVNTNLYLTLNKCTQNMTGDLADQFSFISSQMDAAQKNGQRVLVHGHVPPGFSELTGDQQFWTQAWNDAYLKSFEAHGDLVMGHLYGHEHTDTFRLSKNNGVMFVAPTACPLLHNPGVRRFTLGTKSAPQGEGSQLILQRYEQYWMDLLVSNKQLKIDWKLEYASDQQPYNLPDLTLDSLTKLAGKFAKDSILFYKYVIFNNVWLDPLPCTGKCKTKHMCSIQYAYFEDFVKCMNGTSSVQLEID